MLEQNEKYAIIYAAIQEKPVTIREIAEITGESKANITHYLNRIQRFEIKKDIKVINRTVYGNIPKANKMNPFLYEALLDALPLDFLADGRKPAKSRTNTPSAALWGDAEESTVSGVKNKNKLGYEGENGIVRLSNVHVKTDLRKAPKTYPSGSSLDGIW